MCDVYASVHVFMEEKLFLRAVKGGKNTKIITLNGKKMTKIPSTIGNLPGLKVLNLQKNLVSKVCSELSTLTQLTVLNLGNNLLEEVPEEVKYLTSLKNLHLFGNRINRFASGACDGLKNLILLNLNNNQLTYIPKEVSRLESLIYLTINHNQLTSIPRELCFLKNLSELQLNYNQLICIPEEIKFLKRLRKLFLARNNIEVLPEEITSRFVMNELTERNPFLMEAIEWYPEVWDIISKGRKCAICGKSFLGIWIECVEFVSPSKNWKISRNLTLVPLRTLICSYQCFNLRGPNQFGIARVQSSEKLI
ncbi:leucine-rich repeat-containing protein 69 isoform X4 [Myotis myotis]|uniref:leucine-rich repeat-containing protein 69 isoform X4 n=1 Tax=Myotis myotis TaxID=51298 RepID=UPI001749F2C1|nr:leucine-rich repeat-containing protein 69 isoform X4 [Myotis myotis]